MNDTTFQQLLEAARDYVRQEMQRSEPFRRIVHHLGLWLVSEAEAFPKVFDRPPVYSPPVDADMSHSSSGRSTGLAHDHPIGEDDVVSPDSQAARPAPISSTHELPASSGLVPLKIGDATVHVPVVGTTEEIGRARASAEAEPAQPALVDPVLEEGAQVDLKLVERRSRLKAESCSLCIKRRAATGDPDREPGMIEQVASMIAQAKVMPDCFLWVLWRERSQPDDATLQRIARCYEALAATAALVVFCDEPTTTALTNDREQALQLLAEADSALRVALQSTWLTSPDVDQDEVHSWLRRETAIRRVLLRRYMRLDDPADPAQADMVMEQARQLRSRIELRVQIQKEVASLLGQVRYHARNLLKNGCVTDPHDCRKICEAIERLCALGLTPDDRRIGESLGSVSPEVFPAEVVITSNVQRALDAFGLKAADARVQPQSEEAVRQWSHRVSEVRQLIQGTSIALVGGEQRRDATERIRDAFALADVEWVRLNEHGSGEAMRAPIEHVTTSVVLVLVKLAGHLHAEEASRYARKAGKPCVFLKAGYNPEQIADAVLEQAGEQLRARVTQAVHRT